MDSSYIKLSATTAASTSAAFTIAGECKLIANNLTGSESVKLLEEDPAGNYVLAVDKDGVGVMLTGKQPSQIMAGYGSYKVQKSATIASVAVAVVS